MQLNTKKYDAFVRTFSIMRAGVRLIAIEEVRNCRKIVCIKNIFENGWWEDMHTHHSTSLDPPLAISYRNHQKSLAYFNPLAPVVLLFFTKRQSQKPPLPPNKYAST